MITKRIFEIPIYSISQEKFYEKWDIRNEKKLSEWINAGWTYSEAKSEIARLAFPKTIWKYAQIIGYLVVDITKSDIWFDVYAPLNNNGIRYDTTAKTFPQAWSLNGTHFPLEKEMSNAEIIKEIKKWVIQIQNDHISKWHLDLTTVLNSIDYIDFCRLVTDLSNSQ